ncbi:MAG TPA: methyltransferase domain-containing protein [Bryobacteraceae bacterium]|nr:methyltransferase domain-containing protein [Bryobacteraceae bacterium]
MEFLNRILRRPGPLCGQSSASAAEIRAYFNRAAADEEHYPSTIDPRIYHVKLILEHLGDLSGKHVADIGCGKGRFARILKESYPSASVAAVDIAEAMLTHVPQGIHRVAGSITAIPLAAASCDGAYATESLEHAVDIPAAISELTRIVKPGGRIAIIDKNAQAWGRLETPEWERWFERKELERLLARSCRRVWSQPISYWEDVEPDGLFLAWLAEK